MAPISVLQANVGNCAAAQDLLLQSVAQLQATVAIVAEPYAVRARDNWAGSRDELVAIVSQRRAFDRVLQGRGCVLALLGDVAVVGVYFSPNRSLAEDERWLIEVGALLAEAHPTPVVVAGDFNAHSRAWGSPETDSRGEMVQEWAVSNGLVLLNLGAGPHVRAANGDGSQYNRPVLCQFWPGQPHTWLEGDRGDRYIWFDIVDTGSGTPAVGDRRSVEEGPRWRLQTLDRELAKEAAIVERWAAGDVSPDVDARAAHWRATFCARPYRPLSPPLLTEERSRAVEVRASSSAPQGAPGWSLIDRPETDPSVLGCPLPARSDLTSGLPCESVLR